MTEVLVGVADQPAGAGIAEIRTRPRDGTGKLEQYIIPVSERVPSFKGMVGSFRMIGSAATPQNLFSLEHATGSGLIVAVRRLSVQMDATALMASVAEQFKASRATGTPAGGQTLTKVGFDTNQSSHANVTARCGASADGTNVAITGLTAGTTGWHQFAMRMHTLAGQVLMEDESCIPIICADDPCYLRPGETLLLQGINGTAANNLATNHYIVNCVWEEFTLP